MKKSIYLLIALLTLSGCIKDLTVTEFNEVELPVLVVPEDPSAVPDCFLEDHQYNVKFGDVLKLVPEISYSKPEDLAYEWKINGESVSTEKDLVWTCDLEKNSSGALYVTRKSVGTSVVFSFSIALNFPYERGWVVIADNGGKIEYSFLQEVPGRPYEYHPYPEFYLPGTSAGDWIGNFEFWSNESKSVKGHMLHLEKKLDGCTNVDELTMLPTVSLQKEFLGEKFPEQVNYFKSAVYGGYVAYLLGDNGKIYGRKSESGYYTGRFFDMPVQFDGKDLKVSSFVDVPYNAGIVLIYDEETGFKSITNAYGSGSNAKAGLVSRLPESGADDLNGFKGEEIIYSRFLQPAGWGEDNVLFLVSRNLKTGVYSASEYNVAVSSNGIIAETSSRYVRKPIPDFGEKSTIIVLENPYGFVGENVYYTDNADPTVLYYAKRSRSGLSDIEVYHKFGSPVVSLDQGKIQSSFQNIGVALEDNSVIILDLSRSKNKYVAPEGDKANSLLYEWKGIEGKILKLDFRYGNISNYFS